MNKISRREAVTGVLAAGAGVLAFSGESVAMQEVPVPAFGAKHAPKPLPFDPTKLTGISEKLIRSHHENNYTGAVKALNVVEQRLVALKKEKDLPAYVYGDLKRQELIRTGSIVMHENYFANLGGKAEDEQLTIDRQRPLGGEDRRQRPRRPALEAMAEAPLVA